MAAEAAGAYGVRPPGLQRALDGQGAMGYACSRPADGLPGRCPQVGDSQWVGGVGVVGWPGVNARSGSLNMPSRVWWERLDGGEVTDERSKRN